jgi:hypothetical protein
MQLGSGLVSVPTAGPVLAFIHYPHFRPGFWVRSGSRAFARMSSRALGRYVVRGGDPDAVPTDFNGFMWRSNGFQRVYVALQASPQTATGHLGHQNAGRPDPLQPAPHLPRLVCGGNHGAPRSVAVPWPPAP